MSIDNEQIARALGWTKCTNDFHPMSALEWRPPDWPNGYDRCVLSLPDFSTPDGLAEVKAWVEAKGWGHYGGWNREGGYWHSIWSGAEYFYAKGTSEAEAFLAAFLAAHEESTPSTE